MGKHIYFHVGTVKTGSTLIQKVLWENRKLLEDFNFYYYDQVEPKLSYPRYANAEFLFDKDIKISAKEIHDYIENVPSDNIIISEEGLWANMYMLSNEAFEGFEKTVILYVRKPVDLVAAWASENAEPYNAIQKLHSSGIGVVSIEQGIKEFTNRYIAIFKKFFSYLKNNQNLNVIIRPYDREQFPNKDIFSDFLTILNIDSETFFKSHNFQQTKIANTSKTRKYCDVSVKIWDILSRKRKEQKYSLKLVNYVYENCKSGDDRPVLQTLSFDTIMEVYNKLSFIQDELSQKYLKGKGLFATSMPILEKDRLEYRPIDDNEVEKLVESFIDKDEQKSIEKEKRIDKIRNLALEFEKSGDIESAHQLMTIGLRLRPNGPFIQKKCDEYRRILNKGIENDIQRRS